MWLTSVFHVAQPLSSRSNINQCPDLLLIVSAAVAEPVGQDAGVWGGLQSEALRRGRHLQSGRLH